MKWWEGENHPYPEIERGLLAYAAKVINNEVINDFKRLSRTDDLPWVVLNDGVSPEISNADTVAYEAGEGEEIQQVIQDPGALADYGGTECQSDIVALLSRTNLTKMELQTVVGIDLQEKTAREVSKELGKSVQRVRQTHGEAIRKMKIMAKHMVRV